MKGLPSNSVADGVDTRHGAARVAGPLDLFQKEDAAFRFTSYSCFVVVGVSFVGFDPISSCCSQSWTSFFRNLLAGE